MADIRIFSNVKLYQPHYLPVIYTVMNDVPCTWCAVVHPLQIYKKTKHPAPRASHSPLYFNPHILAKPAAHTVSAAHNVFFMFYSLPLINQEIIPQTSCDKHKWTRLSLPCGDQSLSPVRPQEASQSGPLLRIQLSHCPYTLHQLLQIKAQCFEVLGKNRGILITAVLYPSGWNLTAFPALAKHTKGQVVYWARQRQAPENINGKNRMWWTYKERTLLK